MKTQMCLHLEAGEYDDLRTTAERLGVTQGALVALYQRHAQRTMKPEALESWARSVAEPRGRPRIGGLRRVERELFDALVTLHRKKHELMFDVIDLQGVIGFPPREIYRVGRLLEGSGLASVTITDSTLDAWGRPRGWSLGLNDAGRSRASLPTKAQALEALRASLREEQR
jgi:hypothetical protein